MPAGTPVGVTGREFAAQVEQIEMVGHIAPAGHWRAIAYHRLCRFEAAASRDRAARSGGADIGDEAIDVGAQCGGLAAELLRRGQDLGGRRAGLVGGLVDTGDVA
jgi:hypothetical protein